MIIAEITDKVVNPHAILFISIITSLAITIITIRVNYAYNLLLLIVSATLQFLLFHESDEIIIMYSSENNLHYNKIILAYILIPQIIAAFVSCKLRMNGTSPE
jgi:2-polyprenyl-3-methyl-5-hydroxy-6-metoxy-1,4-benzoquinol methylase